MTVRSRYKFLRICCLIVGARQVLTAQTATFFPRVSEPLESEWAIAADSTGLYVAGQVRQSSEATDDARAYVRKFDAYGAELWTRQFDGPSAVSGVAASGSGVYVAGNADSNSNSGRELLLGRYDSDGNELWT